VAKKRKVVSQADIDKRIASGAVIKKKAKPAPVIESKAAPSLVAKKKKSPLDQINTENSSPQMRLAVAAAQRAAEAANRTAEKILTVIKEGTGKNREILNEIKDAVEVDPVIKLKINRGKDDLMTDIELIRTN